MASPFCMICPARPIIPSFSGKFDYWKVDFSTTAKMVLTTLGMIVTALFLVGSFVKKRFFCFFCPMSALQYLISRPALLTLRKDGSKCTRCGDCYRVCDMEIKEIADDVTNPRIMMDDCTLCLKCVDALTVSGESLGERVGASAIKDESVIRKVENAYSQVGGLAILFGNLAEQGCVIKTAGIIGERKFSGKAVCFNSPL